ncbi:MAG: helix-turn-helix domain-containing protein [Lentisphaeria bacterium]|nr:helix-turn-helix domain-containing protein [Lentisphaeria bacterium]
MQHHRFSYFKTSDWIFRSDPDFPLRAGIQDPQEETVLHEHEFCECAFILSGQGMHQSEKNPPVPIQRGDVIFIPIGGHHAYTQGEGLSVGNLLFSAPRLPSVLLELYSSAAYKQIFLKRFSPETKDDFPMTHLEEDVFFELETLLYYLAGSTSHCCKMGIFAAILGRLCEVWKIAETEKSPPLDIFKLTAFMEHNFHKELLMSDLCRMAAMSSATLQRHFKAALGVPPMTYLRNLRLKHAAELLLNSQLELNEIAELSGFRQMPPFFRAFKKCYGITPLEYRRKK